MLETVESQSWKLRNLDPQLWSLRETEVGPPYMRDSDGAWTICAATGNRTRSIPDDVLAYLSSFPMVG